MFHPFYISVTHRADFECISPYNFRTIQSEQAPIVLISIAAWMCLNQPIIALFYKYDNFILSMCIVDLQLMCYSNSLFYHMVYLRFPWLTKLNIKFYIKFPYLYI